MINEGIIVIYRVPVKPKLVLAAYLIIPGYFKRPTFRQESLAGLSGNTPRSGNNFNAAVLGEKIWVIPFSLEYGYP